jgi:hypothetical protein
MVAGRKIAQSELIIIIIIALTSYPIYSNALAQTNTTFTSSDKFIIPELNGSIRFNVNGTYSSSLLQNNSWVFTDLKLANSPIVRTLKISVENSNMTVYSYRTSPQFGRSTSLRFNVDGQGKQSVNLGLNITKATDSSEWLITIPNGGIVVEGIRWNLLPDNTVVVNGLSGNVSISHFNYTMPTSTGPFYVQHSIAIITGAVAAAVIAVAVIIRIKVRA